MNQDQPQRPVNELAPLLRARHGQRVRKLCLKLGATCPNRDGTLGLGGCLFCAEPEDLPLPPLALQLTRALARLPQGTGVIGYLQDHSATYTSPEKLDEALSLLHGRSEVVSIALGTRPDCLGPEILAVLARHVRAGGPELLVELGLQSVREDTLRFNRRLHTVACFDRAVARLQDIGARVCAHVVLGLPRQDEPGGPLRPEGEAAARDTAAHLALLGVDAVKLHHCHVLRHSPLEALYRQGRFEPPDLDGYIRRLAAFLPHLPWRVEVHRLVGECPGARLVAPEFTAQKAASLQQIRRELRRLGVVQGASAG